MSAIVPSPNPAVGNKLAAGPALMLALGCVALVMVSILSLMIGPRYITPTTLINAFQAFDGNLPAHIILRDTRLPRTLLGLICGAAVGTSGALVQAATRNPLADPGILGVNAGAAFAMTVAAAFIGLKTVDAYIWIALLGAMLTTLVVCVVCSAHKGSVAPVRLVLSGVALSAVLGGIGSSITLLTPQAFDAMRVWSVGSISGRDVHVFATVAPFIAVGLVIAVASGPSLNAVALGEDLARSLGTDIIRSHVLVVLAVTLLCGAATAACGPIGFVGLMVPHAVRRFCRSDQRWISALTMVFSPVLLLVADIIGRLILYPAELEVGIVIAFIGAPVLILLARHSKASRL